MNRMWTVVGVILLTLGSTGAQATELDCQRLDACQTLGHCTETDGACLAGSDADCEQSELCAVDGKCAAQKGACAANSTSRCGAATRCKGQGLCIAKDGQCVAESDADCKLSEECLANGQCTARGGMCIAASNKDCAPSSGCKDDGRCIVRDTRCIAASDADCKGSLWCKLGGFCTAQRGWCLAGSDADCKESKRCKEKGLCFALEGDCYADPVKDCQKIDACRLRGGCTKTTLGNSCFVSKEQGKCTQTECCRLDYYNRKPNQPPPRVCLPCIRCVMPPKKVDIKPIKLPVPGVDEPKPTQPLKADPNTTGDGQVVANTAPPPSAPGVAIKAVSSPDPSALERQDDVLDEMLWAFGLAFLLVGLLIMVWIRRRRNGPTP